MDKKQAHRAIELARSSKVLHESLDVFLGHSLPDYEQVYCTIESVALLIRYQCIYFNGSMDTLELNNLINIGRKKFNII